MMTIRRAFTGIGAGLVLLFTATSTADATPATTTPHSKSVCTTGFRGQPAYDRLCLTTGDLGDAAYEWYAPYNRSERRAQCRMAVRLGYRAMVTETRGDVLSDTYRNDHAMVRMVAVVARAECARH